MTKEADDPLFIESKALLEAAQYLHDSGERSYPYHEHAMAVGKAAARLALELATSSKRTTDIVRSKWVMHAIQCQQFVGDIKMTADLCELFLTWPTSTKSPSSQDRALWITEKTHAWLRQKLEVARSRPIEEVVDEVAKGFETGHPLITLKVQHHNWISRSSHQLSLVTGDGTNTSYTLVIADVDSSHSHHYPCRLQWMFRETSLTIDTSQKLEEHLRRFLSSEGLRKQLIQLRKNADKSAR